MKLRDSVSNQTRESADEDERQNIYSKLYLLATIIIRQSQHQLHSESQRQGTIVEGQQSSYHGKA